jgi:hypothetical protein
VQPTPGGLGPRALTACCRLHIQSHNFMQRWVGRQGRKQQRCVRAAFGLPYGKHTQPSSHQDAVGGQHCGSCPSLSTARHAGPRLLQRPASCSPSRRHLVPTQTAQPAPDADHHAFTMRGQAPPAPGRWTGMPGVLGPNARQCLSKQQSRGVRMSQDRVIAGAERSPHALEKRARGEKEGYDRRALRTPRIGRHESPTASRRSAARGKHACRSIAAARRRQIMANSCQCPSGRIRRDPWPSSR